MLIVELPVAPYSPPAKIQEWITELKAMRKSPHAEPYDLWLIGEYLVMAQGWLEEAQPSLGTKSGSASLTCRSSNSRSQGAKR
jgi:hypothetical protein